MLAALRVVVALCVVATWREQRPVDVAGLPEGLLQGRLPGSGWLYELLGPTPDVVRAASVLLLAAAALLLVGLWARPAAIVTGLLGVYVLGVPQLTGKVDHYHHVVWFCFALALGPCGDAWSVDAWRQRRHRHLVPAARSARYGFPLGIVIVLLGIVYLLPGLAKLRTAQLRWALSDNLANLVHLKSWELGRDPLLHVERWPVVSRAAALALLAFEVGFFLLVLVPRLRLVAVAGGVLFHVLSAATVGIFFWSLLAAYVVFADRAWVVGRSPPGDGRRPSTALVAGGALLVGLAVLPVLTIRPSGHAWPFASYPTFAGLQGTSVETVAAVPVVDGAEVAALTDDQAFGGLLPPQRYRALLDSLRDGDPSRLQAVTDGLRPTLPGGTTEVRFYRRTVSVLIGDRQGEILEERLVGAVPVD